MVNEAVVSVCEKVRDAYAWLTLCSSVVQWLAESKHVEVARTRRKFIMLCVPREVQLLENFTNAFFSVIQFQDNS